MGYMRKYKCPGCLNTQQVIRKTKRGDSIRYLCKTCRKGFSVKTVHVDRSQILSDHLDGLSFRDLARRYHISSMTAWRICEEQLRRLPNNNQFTHKYCDRFSHIFVVDGKYFNVAADKYDWVLLWGVDYFRHDIPVFTLAPSENYQSWARYFSYFRILSHHPDLIVCDDNYNIKLAAHHAFPTVKIQTCHNHFKENLRRSLKVRSDTTYKPFMKRVETILGQKRNDRDMNTKLFALYRDYHTDPVTLSVLTNIEKYKKELLAYRGISQAPITSNIIEGLNGHLESRLHSLRSFQSIGHARLWFNGYILKRRFTKFTDCKGKFKYMNGKTGVQLTKKHRIILPTLF